jgi:hypothetical protein
MIVLAMYVHAHISAVMYAAVAGRHGLPEADGGAVAA